MTVLAFGSARHLSSFTLFFLVPGLAAVFAAAFAAVYHRLNEHASLDILIAPPGGRFWGLVGALGVAAYLLKSCSLLLPGGAWGALTWPVEMGAAAYARHVGELCALGAAVFWLASDRGLAGNSQSWEPPRPSAWPRLWAVGALLGMAAGVAGACAHRWLFLAHGLRRAQWPSAAYLAAAAATAALPASAVLFVYQLVAGPERPDVSSLEGFSLPAPRLSRARRLTWCTLLLLAWTVPLRLTESYLARGWDFGAAGLAAAAGIPDASRAGKARVIVLSDERGSPGRQVRDVTVATSGVDASPASLDRLRAYLEGRSLRTVFAVEGLAALRQGWALNWDLDRYLDAASLHGGARLPPDFPGFLAGIRTAPVTQENFSRLQKLAEYASGVKLVRVDQTQKLYEGFSAAYAHFGEMKESNLWLDKIQGLWPLYSEDVQVEPVEQDLECAVSGSLFLEGRPATAVKVGLFAIRSTNTVIGAFDGLVGAAYPDSSGAFEFAHLAPGRYYLAARAAPSVLGDSLEVTDPPGALRLTPERPAITLPPIGLQERASRMENSPQPPVDFGTMGEPQEGTRSRLPGMGIRIGGR